MDRPQRSSRRPAGFGGPRTSRVLERGENRLPPAVATVVAAGVYAFLPSTLHLLPKYVLPGIELVLLLALVVTNPVRMTRQSKWSRIASIGLALVVVFTNLASLVLLVKQLNGKEPAGPMLVGAMQVWVTGVIGFALLYWEIDRGGPVARYKAPRDEVPLADWRFSQDENKETVSEVKQGASEVVGWMPEFVDYFYMSLTNSSAFSPTDTMPMSSRAKMLMGTQATAALFTSLLVVARAVGALGG